MRNLVQITIVLAAFIVTIFLLKINPFVPNAYCNISNMPLVLEPDPKLSALRYAPPKEERGKEVRIWLQSSFKVEVDEATGSGTLIYYDRKHNIGYIVSCGHLWDGDLDADERKKPKAEVITWYHNDKKLKKPKRYKAKVLCHSNQDGFDISVLTFKPDWIPEIYYPIAPKNHRIYGWAHSVGCDGGNEVAHYSVHIMGIRDGDLITQYNSPRPGRSGGGLMDSKGYFIGICWGTSNYEGTGLGYFTPLKAIHKYLQNQGFEFLLNKPLPIDPRRIPILDQKEPRKNYPPDYIPMPNR
jgi:hypothetical protein